MDRYLKRKERLDVDIDSLSVDPELQPSIQKYEDLMKLQQQSVPTVWLSKDDRNEKEYRTLLIAAVDCVRFLLRQGLPFHDCDESFESENQGNYLELFHFLTDHNEEVKKISFENASSKFKLTSLKVQKEICSAAAAETLSVIMNDIGNCYFSILVDETSDVSTKQQMSIAVRYVNKRGQVIERFIGIIHVSEFTAVALEAALEAMLAKHSLSLLRIRGQGYDETSNMRGEFHDLKALILNDNPHAFYVPCFSHQLSLCLVAISKNHWQVKHLFEFITRIVNTVGASCKINDALKILQHDRILLQLKRGELISRRSLNQETILQHAGDTHYGSHYHTLISLMKMYASTLEMLEIVKEDGIHDQHSVEAGLLIDVMESFDFIFTMHLMIDILGITNELSQTLRKKDQDIQNAIKLVQVFKQRLQLMRENGWNSLLNEVSNFCNIFQVDVPDMNSEFKPRRRSARKAEDTTNLHHYRVDLFYAVIGMQFQELNSCFPEASTELLLCIACLNPRDSFFAFDKHKLIRLAKLYSGDFSAIELVALEHQLSTYIIDMRTCEEFSSLIGIADLAKEMVKTKKNVVYHLVYRLITLALTLPVATATVERAFSTMKVMKHRLQSKMGDEWLNDYLVLYIEKEVFDLIPNEIVIERYQKNAK